MDKRKDYIDGFKGFLCCMVMNGHYFGMCKYASDMTAVGDSVLVYLAKNKLVNILLNESFWLYGFFVISGYLLSHSRITTIKSFMEKIFVRFIRFLLPIMGTYLFIYLIYLVVGFHNNIPDIIANEWLQSFYTAPIGIADIIKDPFYTILQGKSTLNAPFWVIRDIFFSSIVIYFFCLCEFKIKKKFYLIVILSLIVLSKVNIVIFACSLGSSLGYLTKYLEKSARYIYNKSRWLFICWVLVYIAILILLRNYNTGIFYSFFFLFTLVIVCNVNWCKALSSTTPFPFLGKISFGIYSFHWPIICSFGCLLLVALYRNGNLRGLILLSVVWFTSILLTVLISILYHNTVEAISTKAVNSIKKKCKMV